MNFILDDEYFQVVPVGVLIAFVAYHKIIDKMPDEENEKSVSILHGNLLGHLEVVLLRAYRNFIFENLSTVGSKNFLSKVP